MHVRHYTGFHHLELSAAEYGEPGQPPVIMLHGGGQTRHAWSGAARSLAAAGHRVICPDARGHGDSRWPDDGDYGLDAFAGDLRAIIATLAQPPVLVGASLGGATALLLAGESPAPPVSALVLVDIVPRPDPAGVQNVFSFMSARPEGFANLDEVADAVAAYNPHRPRPDNHAGLMRNLRRREDGRLYWHWDPRFLNPAHRFEPSEYHRRLDAAAAQVRIPTLLVRGALSDIVSVESAREFQRSIPGCELVDVAGAGHMVAGDRNDVFNQAIADFLRRHGQAQPAALA